MTPSRLDPGVPTEEARLGTRTRPAGWPVMRQQWRDLLFLHWEYPASTIQETLPDGLFVDTFGGKAYLGVVPFFMQNVRPCGLPPVPGLSNFMELNLRTYVYDRAGVPGVWFYSLDANQALAVIIARRFFHLPYQHARMRASRDGNGGIHYESTRLEGPGQHAACVFEYRPGESLPGALPGSLESFLVERYRLFCTAHGKLRCGSVYHQPYPLCRAEATAWDENLLTINRFAPTGRPPDHIVMSRGVDVSINPLVQAAFSE